ncbi:MAG: adenylyltransferase/cytidyltransferase family protein [gamma proteobacterium symbiont of Taylorina sp.]|nr:adenylyltransferase/cytidyltransferase family protein [gamma proteobacterium symbiont of Taylorina sp.]
MSSASKIITNLDEIKTLSKSLKNGSLVLCNGHFNIIHPGHMRFIQYAKSLGDYLCVAVLSDDYLTKDNQWEPFPEYERANAVASLLDVDYVIILDKVDLNELIGLLHPDTFVMGHEFENKQTHDVKNWIISAKNTGARIVFHSGSVNYATSHLLDGQNDYICNHNTEEYKRSCKRQGILTEQLAKKCRLFKNSKILVLGDTIVDQFIACDPLGMSSEAPVLALKELEKKEFIGGAAIVACHIKSLGAQSFFLSVTGQDQPAEFVKEKLKKSGINHTLFIDKERPTTFKIRYMVESQKMLRVSRLEDRDIPHAIEESIEKKLEEIIPDMNGIIISDFVYGVITDRILNTTRKLARLYDVKLFGDLQCSSQTGNIIKFQKFNLLTPTEREARIALGDKNNGLEKLAIDLLVKTGAENLLITLGSEGFIAYHIGDNERIQSEHFPALATNPIDVAGAGDALLSVISLGLSSGLTFMESAALSGCASSIAVNRMGNIPIELNELEQFIKRLN